MYVITMSIVSNSISKEPNKWLMKMVSESPLPY